MSTGFFFLHRKILDSPVFASAELLKVWIWCLARASYCRRTIPMRTGRGETLVSLDPGQFVFGRKAAANELQMAESTIHRRMKWLEKVGCVNIQASAHWSLVSVVNWDIYQRQNDESEQATEQAMDKKRTGNGRPTDTNKKGKNIKKGNNLERDKKTIDDDGARCISFSEHERAEVTKIANTIAAVVIPRNAPDDRSIVIKSAVLVHRGELSENDLCEVLESVRLKKPKNGVAWFYKCMENRTSNGPKTFEAMLAGITLPAELLRPRGEC